MLLHAATTVLLFLILWRMTANLWPSAFVAALFAVHPLHVESVAWVAQRKDVLSGLFFMLTIGAYLGYVSHPFSLVRYLIVVVVFALGLMAKPVLVTLPILLLLLDYWPLRRIASWGGSCTAAPGATVQRSPQRGVCLLRWLIVEKIPLMLLAAASCVAAPVNEGEAVMPLHFLPVSSPHRQWLGFLRGLCGAVLLARRAWRSSIPIRETVCPSGTVVGAALLLACVSLAALVWLRRVPYLFVGWFWYLGTLVPMIGLVQIGSHAKADRYTYVTQIGLCIALAWGAADLCRSWPRLRWVCRMGSALVVGALLVFAWRQTTYWRDSAALWTRDFECTERNCVAHVSLGSLLAARGHLDDAIAHFRKALEIEPLFAEAHNNLGDALTNRGQVNDAIVHYRRALKINPGYADAHYNLGTTLVSLGRLDEAADHFRQTLAIRPEHVKALVNLGEVLRRQGRPADAAAYLQKALKINPDDAEVCNNLGAVLFSAGRFDEARAQFQQAIRIDPDDAQAHNNLGSTFDSLDRPDEAIAQFQRALEIRPNDPEARRNLQNVLSKTIRRYRDALQIRPDDAATANNLAWLLATSPVASLRNGGEAVEIARRADQLSGGREPAILGTLAAAYAEAGRFPEALSTAQRALELAVQQNRQGLADALRGRVAEYEARRRHLPSTSHQSRP